MNHNQSPIEQAYREGFIEGAIWASGSGYEPESEAVDPGWSASDAKENDATHVTISRDDLQCAVEALASTVAEYDRLWDGFPKRLAAYDEDRAALGRLRAILSLNEVHAER